MAKKTAAKAAADRPVTTSLASVQDSAQITLIIVPAGGNLRVVVEVGPMAIPYAVAYAARTIIKSLVDRSELVEPIQDGDRMMTWSFAHVLKDWHHSIGYSINDGPVKLLERKSEANKDADHSVGVAIVRH